MKFKVMLKDPDAFFEAVTDVIDVSLKGTTFSEDEFEALAEIWREKISESISKWVKFSECITIEFDTTAGTATVVPIK